MNKMKRIVFLFLTICLSLFCPATVAAHVLKVDGSIGVIIHVSPDDDPIAGQESEFFFEFKDKEGKFSPEKCDCSISITTNGNEIVREQLFSTNTDASLKNANFSYVFPQKGVYIISLIGTPYTPDMFQKFSLTYDLRVERTVKSVSQKTAESDNWFVSHVPHVIGVVFAVGLLVCVMYLQRKRKK